MTKEEIIQAISDDKMMPFIQPDQLAQIVAFVIENYRPSLPSNLDEAARMYSERTRFHWPNQVKHAYDAFKAGAEWVDGQGASFNTKVRWMDGPTILDWPDDILDKFIMGDEVIVQIRKKQ